jgi:hypothetical protein
MSSLVAESERSPLAPRAGRARAKPAVALAVALVLVAAGVLALLRLAAPAAQPAAERTAKPTPFAGASKRQALAAYGKLPLAFVPNRGQTDARVRYSAQQAGMSVFFTRGEAVLSLAKGKKGAALALRFLGASPAAIEGRHLGTGRVNYLLGNDTAKWHSGLPSYGQVVYRNLWPGVDMVFRGAAGQLKYEFVLRPGAKVTNIRLAYRGAGALSLDKAGNLLIPTPLGVLRDERPRSYQEIHGRRVPVASRFSLAANHARAYGVAVGQYDSQQPLVIDPGLVYSTFLGGSTTDFGNGIAVDAAGDAHVTGFTVSSDFPTSVGAFDTSQNGGGSSDAFVTKLNPAGTALLYSTYLGGSSADVGRGIALDAAGDAYVTGQTGSSDFPTSGGAFDTSHNGGSDVFVTKLNPAGSALVYSTFLGGSGLDQGTGIALDGVGDAYLTGQTASSDFPSSVGAFDTSHNGGDGAPDDAFATKLNPLGSALLYSTYLGGSGNDVGFGIALDPAGDAYLTGQTGSSDFPTSAGAFDTSHNGLLDVFVSKLNPAGTALLYSTFLGGSSNDQGTRIALDAAGDAYVTGQTQTSSNFPTSVGAFDTSYNGGGLDAFVTKLNPLGSALLYSTFLGGSDMDEGTGIALDAAGDAYLTGFTGSSDFPTSAGAFDTSHNGSDDVFMTKLNPAGSALLYSTFLGGSGIDGGLGIALDAAGDAYLTGFTTSSDFPTSVGAFQTTKHATFTAFVTKLSSGPGAPATLTLAPPAATNTVGATHCVTATVEDAAGNPVPGVTVRFSVPTAVATHASPASGSATTNASGQATFCYSASLPGEDAIHAFADTDNDTTEDAGEPFGDATKTWTPPANTAFCEVTITNGGWIVADNGDRANFGGNAKVSADGLSVQGQEGYQDQGSVQPLTVHSIRLLATTCSSDLKSATIYGTATIDGSGTHVFRIDVNDMGSPGSNDSYGIILDTGYASGQKQLQGGNVTIHK